MGLLKLRMGKAYLYTIVLLVAIALVSSYSLDIVPIGILCAVIAASLTDFLVEFYKRKQFQISASAIITGLIVGSVAPYNAPLLIIIFAAMLAVVSKYLLKIKDTNIFNPATLGLFIAILLFATSDEWWVASNYNVLGISISLTPLLFLAAYEARRLPTSFSFLGASILLAFLIHPAAYSLSIQSLLALVFGANFYLAFIMLADPRTSPIKNKQQVLFGIECAVFIMLFGMLRLASPILLGVLAVNLVYAITRHWKWLKNAVIK